MSKHEPFSYRSHFGSDLIRIGRVYLPEQRFHGGLEVGGREFDGAVGQRGLPRSGNEKGAQKKEQRVMGEQYRDEVGGYGPHHGSVRDWRDLHPIHPSVRLSEPQGGRMQECGEVPDVQGFQGRAPDEYRLQRRAHDGHDTVDQDYEEGPDLEGGDDREEILHGVYTTINGGYEEGEGRRIAVWSSADEQGGDRGDGQDQSE
eukprot:15865880-Heterocapsa_arctica.AAC.1